ncbi:MAG TPA: copper chaperone PCu(A)C [Anaeromyxobacteraceae bacterium]|nr:copper chaperone PCu(A)C [Anaeromyxobacteraceae bacterium]
MTDGAGVSRQARRESGRAGWKSAPRRLALLALGAAACSGSPSIAIAGQEARLSPVLLRTCSIFMRIENAGSGDDSLLGATVGIPGAVAELHGVVDGKMVKQQRVRIPARGAVELRPGGLHVMVFGLPGEVGQGYEFTLRLAFERAGEKVTSVRIAG